MFPTFTLGKTIYLTSLISGNTLKEASKEIINSIVLFSDKWNFTQLKDIDMRVFPKITFRPDGHLDLSTDELLLMKSTYYRMVQSGVPLTKIVRALMYEYKASFEQITELLTKFDNQSTYRCQYQVHLNVTWTKQNYACNTHKSGRCIMRTNMI